MTEKDLKKMIHWRVEEFEPVRLHLSNGDTLEIHHPDHFLIGPSATAVLVDGVIEHVANAHINRVEPLKTAATK